MTSPDPVFGSPAETVPPLYRSTLSRRFWPKVVDYIKGNPGVWHPLVNAPFRQQSLRNIAAAKVSDKEHSKRQLPTPLRDARIGIAYRTGTMYLRWDEETS